MAEGSVASDTQEQKWKKGTIWWKYLVESSEAWDPGVLTPALDKHKGLGQRDDVLSGPTSVPPKVQDFVPSCEELGILPKG